MNIEEKLQEQKEVSPPVYPLSITIEHDSSVSYAMLQNLVPVIKRIKVHNSSEETYHDIHLVITSDPEFFTSYDVIISKLSPDETYTLHTVPVLLSHQFFRNIISPVQGSIEGRITCNDTLLGKNSYQIRILAYDHWSGLHCIPELLSAFITPNADDITSVISEVQEILKEWTGDSSLTDYQSNDIHRVRMMAAAVYAAIQRYNIRYATSEPGFEQEGQKIRLADKIIRERKGNCLDLTLLYAGCIERIGLHPLVVIMKDHAFAGVWLIKDNFDDVTIEDLLPLRKRTDLDEITVIDVINLTAKPEISFEYSELAGKKYLSDEPGFRCIIDVKTSRNGKYHIIPIAFRTDDSAEITEPFPKLPPTREKAPLSLTTYTRGKLGELEPKQSQYPRLDAWMNNLLDLSLRNNLLNFKNSKRVIELIIPDIAKFEDIISEGKTFRIKHFEHKKERILSHSLLPNDPLTSYFSEEIEKSLIYSQLSGSELNKRLINIYTQANKSRDETGAETLYLALGTLVWYENDISEKALNAPIILIPLEIFKKDVTTGFSIKMGDDEVRINNTLLKRLFQDFQIQIPHIDPVPMDDHGIDVSAVLYQIRKSIKNLHRWDVLDTAVIGHFTFLKYLMWRDLHTYSEKFMENELVSNLVDPGRFPFSNSESFLKPSTLDSHVRPDEVFCPIGADSSQLAAVIAAGEGKTFVLHGPPGTGKSQTITNIISHCLALGKTVLFVSEKKVALDVVYSRLKEAGLESFCLELHSNKSHKREVLNQFEKVLNEEKVKNINDWSLYAESIADLRIELNNYVKAIHKVRETGESFYQGVISLIGLRDIEHISLSWPPLSEINKETLEDIRTFLHDFRIITEQIVHPVDNIWRPARCSEWSVRWKSTVDKTLQELEKIIQDLDGLFPILSELLGFNPVNVPRNRLQKFKSIIDLIKKTRYHVPEELLKFLKNPSGLKDIRRFIELATKKEELHASISKKYHEDIFSHDFSEIILKNKQISNAWFLKRKTLTWEIIKEVRPFCKEDVRIEEIIKDIHRIQEYKKLQSEFSRILKVVKPVIGSYLTDEEENRETLKNLLENAEKLKNLATSLVSDPEEYSVIVTAWSSLTRLLTLDSGEKEDTIEKFNQYERLLIEWEGGIRKLSCLLQFDPDTIWTENSVHEYLHQQLETIQAWQKETTKLKGWCQWNRVRMKAAQMELLPVLQHYEDGTSDPQSIEVLIYRSFYHWWVDGIREEDEVLKQFYRPKFEDLIEKFTDLDKIYASMTRDEIKARLFASLPKGTEGEESLELGILRHQIQLQRRHMPVRTLFKNIQNILLKFKPCFLMSPISVAQYLDPEYISFDLVVFDEASQIPVSDAIGTIARGRATIIVGDPKQLPPTNIFQRINDGPEDDYVTTPAELDSILDECIASNIPEMYLEWHYRSQHESLIAFSNYHFYNNNLRTFPSPYARAAISLVNSEGIFDSGYTRTNKAEAETVVKEILKRLSDPVSSSDSIGIITFNERQQDLIQTLLERERLNNPKLEIHFDDSRSDAVFIKNLENVQGDERDVILFSVGYGPDKFGKVSLNFGPLNRDGGERRLNVAITRAKKEIVVFSSLRPEHIDLSRTRKTGVKLLKSFLEYAEKGPKAIAEACRKDERTYISSIEQEIREALSEKGYTVQFQVGCGGYLIDIAVRDPDVLGRFILGILCDGLYYQKAKTARDRDILTTYVLNQLGWKIHRIWATDWWDDKENEILRIVKLIELARSEYSPKTMFYSQEDESEKDAENYEEEPEDIFLSEVLFQPVVRYPEISYVAYMNNDILGTKEDFLSGSHDKEIIRVLMDIVETEGPITRDLCFDRLRFHWQINRKTPKIKQKFESIINTLLFHQEIDGDKIFFWPDHRSFSEYVTYRSHGPEDPYRRKMDDISYQEISNAVIHFVKKNGQMTVSDICQRVGYLFGMKRLTPMAEHRIMKGIDLLLERYEAEKSEDVIFSHPTDKR
ncbi:DUF3320 domain-containing protein [Methanospirillum sp.]|uniref:DUF3320 domain-containing protein n=1 Tax=Methanospirillum sp. TaxID=45200 RepID=UPI0035A066CC